MDSVTHIVRPPAICVAPHLPTYPESINFWHPIPEPPLVTFPEALLSTAPEVVTTGPGAGDAAVGVGVGVRRWGDFVAAGEDGVSAGREETVAGEGPFDVRPRAAPKKTAAPVAARTTAMIAALGFIARH